VLITFFLLIFKAEFSGGVLVCNGVIAIRKVFNQCVMYLYHHAYLQTTCKLAVHDLLILDSLVNIFNFTFVTL